jgi:hypothetical protein
LLIWTSKTDIDKKKQSAISILMTIGLALICFLPFKRMMSTNQFSFWGSNGFVEDTFKPMLLATRYGGEYFGWTNEQVTSYIALGMGILALGLIGFCSKLDNKRQMYTIYALLPLTLIYNLLQFYIFKVPFLNPRTALCFVPLVCICLSYGLMAMYKYKKTLGLVMAMATSSLLIQHFVRAYNSKAVYEWYYDTNTYEVLDEIIHVIDTEKIATPVKVNCHWIFHPSMSYHIKHKYADKIQLVPYHKEFEPESDAMFYFTQNDELERLLPKFNIHKEYNWRSRFLMRKK